MSDGFMVTGPVGTRVFDFMRIRSAIGLEIKGLKMSQGSAVKAAVQKGYVPSSVVARGNVIDRRQHAYDYMSYVITLLTTGGFAKQYGEEIVMGWITYEEMDACGKCPSFVGSDTSNILSSIEKATMCICNKEG